MDDHLSPSVPRCCAHRSRAPEQKNETSEIISTTSIFYEVEVLLLTTIINYYYVLRSTIYEETLLRAMT